LTILIIDAILLTTCRAPSTLPESSDDDREDENTVVTAVLDDMVKELNLHSAEVRE
jgi:hypothetical protein